MSENARYSMTELADLTGLSARTVRYYVQEGLIERPEGRGGPGGRGHFTPRHVRQVRRLLLLKRSGLSHQQIREHMAETHAMAARKGSDLESLEAQWANFSQNALETFLEDHERSLLFTPTAYVSSARTFSVCEGASIELSEDLLNQLPPDWLHRLKLFMGRDLGLQSGWVREEEEGDE